MNVWPATERSIRTAHIVHINKRFTNADVNGFVVYAVNASVDKVD